eukprot:TRINITY_DN23_c0_g1_i2.p2 TRINITY_DN23_c0_g1~~TRINITY_DN23_c0_g1_i2.p2  ORF type:complete len:239 (-),score=78.50 TRINITY_DN23_c0_g1_i2:41-718(-)
MAASPELIEKFNKVTSLKYKDQAIFFLNAFWPEHSADAEKVWACCLKMVELDTVKKADGSDLDEFNAHKFLEAQGETLTVIALRERLRKIDLNFDKKMALVEYLLSKFNAPLEELLRRPQGTNEALHKAQEALAEVQAEIARLEAERARIEEETKQDGVKGARAKAELAKFLAADPTELNKAFITAEAAVRKARKEGSGDQPLGALWWVEREIAEAKKYKPKSQQ